jgi:hypothetical protein
MYPPHREGKDQSEGYNTSEKDTSIEEERQVKNFAIFFLLLSKDFLPISFKIQLLESLFY